MPTKPKVRNPVAMSPLLRKGGAHTKSKTGLRVKARQATYDAYDEWLEEKEEFNNDWQVSNNNAGESPFFIAVK